MGVLEKPRRHAITVRETDASSEVSDDVLSLAESELSEDLISAVPIRTRRRHRRRTIPGIGSANEGGSVRRGRGKRAVHRGENLSYLLNLMRGGDEVEAEETEGNFLIEEAISVFAQILDDEALMTLWEDFVGRSEEEQRAILAQGEAYRRGNVKKAMVVIPEEEEEEEFVDITAKSPEPPAPVAGVEAFKLINGHIQHLLLRRHFPIGILAQLEEEVVSFFEDYPDAVYISQPLPSMDRLIIHALSQFHQLRAESFNGSGGRKDRRTKVENECKTFVKPAQSLVEMIETKSTANKKHG